MKRAISRLIFITCAGLVFSSTLNAQTQRPSKAPPPGSNTPGGLNIVANQKIAADLIVGGTRERATGHVSLHLVATKEEKGAYRIEVNGMNIVFTGVDQRHLAPDADLKQPLGMLAFGLQAGKPQSLSYDQRSGLVSGRVRLFMDASFLAKYAQPAADGKDDLFLTPTIPVEAEIAIDLGGPLEQHTAGHDRSSGTLKFELTADDYKYEAIEVPQFNIEIREAVKLDIEIASIYWLEVARRLCIQPVRIGRITWRSFWRPIIQFSGSGRAFGEPGARREWAKDDIVFNIRDWKTVYSAAYWELQRTEAANLRNEVEDDDCIEVFFVNSLDPDDMWGGGATWGSGTASSQVISSDDNARGGIDFTHLGHELGHVVGLRHPGDPATLSSVAGSSGTLLCPSGYLNDNPQVNSQENEDLLSNPLLTFSIKPISAPSDCLDSADCGACP
jgi:hypothetical protein